MQTELKEMIKKHEGLRLKPYKCTAGKTTIGYGRNLDDVGITEKEADMLLDADISAVTFNVAFMFQNIKTMTDTRFFALSDMMFNLGLTRFRKFKKMIKAINDEDWNKASEEAKDSKWFKQVGSRGKTIVKMLREG